MMKTTTKEKMMSTNATKGFATIGLALAIASGVLACQDDGALENAGEAVDETIDDVTHPNEGPVEKTGRKISESVDDATD